MNECAQVINRQHRRFFQPLQRMKGTDYIKVWKGQIELKQLTPSVTSFAMRYDLNAAQSGEPEVEGGVRDYLQKLRP
jgi:hypothetical protein